MTKINGIDEEDFDYLYDQIHYVYGSISKFCAIAGIAYRKTLQILRHKEFTKREFEYIKKAFKSNKTSENTVGRILDEDRAKIRLCILKNFDNYSEFYRKNNEYDVNYVSNVVKGRLKYKTRKYNEFVKLLEKKYKLN